MSRYMRDVSDLKLWRRITDLPVIMIQTILRECLEKSGIPENELTVEQQIWVELVANRMLISLDSVEEVWTRGLKILPNKEKGIFSDRTQPIIIRRLERYLVDTGLR